MAEQLGASPTAFALVNIQVLRFTTQVSATMGPNLEARASIQHTFTSPIKAKVQAVIEFNTVKGLFISMSGALKATQC